MTAGGKLYRLPNVLLVPFCDFGDIGVELILMLLLIESHQLPPSWALWSPVLIGGLLAAGPH